MSFEHTCSSRLVGLVVDTMMVGVSGALSSNFLFLSCFISEKSSSHSSTNSIGLELSVLEPIEITLTSLLTHVQPSRANSLAFVGALIGFLNAVAALLWAKRLQLVTGLACVCCWVLVLSGALLERLPTPGEPTPNRDDGGTSWVWAVFVLANLLMNGCLVVAVADFEAFSVVLFRLRLRGSLGWRGLRRLRPGVVVLFSLLSSSSDDWIIGECSRDADDVIAFSILTGWLASSSLLRIEVKRKGKIFIVYVMNLVRVKWVEAYCL